MFSFHLPAAFVSSYADRPVDWGYPVADGVSLGEITFLRTYSRVKEDGSKERWHEVCARVINGMYSLQKDHCVANRLPWDDEQAQRSAQEAYERMFTFKWLPPGRGLWMMGTSYVMEHRDSAALNNCFAAETEVITDKGIRNIGEIAGQTVKVLTRNGRWVDAPVRSFGVQPLRRVTLGRGRAEKIVYATGNHNWFASEGGPAKSKGWVTRTTDELRPGMHLQSNFGVRPTMEPSPQGIAHGIVFGDGTTTPGERHANRLVLCGDKNRELLKWFPQNRTRATARGDLEVCDLPNAYRETPSIRENTSYLLGWLMGYFSADGSVSEQGHAVLSSTDRSALEFVRSVCGRIGIGCGDVHAHDRVSNLTGKESTLYRVTLLRGTLTEEFFLIGEHRDRFAARPVSELRCWTVRSVEHTERVEEVFCATVDGYAAFTLAGNILTGNCAFRSTGVFDADNPAEPYAFLMEASMLGIGVGFDTHMTDHDLVVNQPDRAAGRTFVVPDSREGWVESVTLLLNSYLLPGQPAWDFDYSQIRPAGAPIRGFGGTASGYEHLERLHTKLRRVLDAKIDTKIDTELVVDIANLIGVCVVSGNVRRSALIAMGEQGDEDFTHLKDPSWFPERNSYDSDNPGWAWMSNNSIYSHVGMDYTPYLENIRLNGEPGFVWMDVARAYGRTGDVADHKDHRVGGVNPCAEILLEGAGELCCLVEVFPDRHDDYDDYLRTLKFAYLYAKTVALVPTRWEKTNAVMLRNRRIGCSLSGLAAFADTKGLPELRRWMDGGYAELKRWDTLYAEWLCVRESIRVSCVKPSGSVSIVSGSTPGVHWTPGGKRFMRAIRFGADDPMVPLLAEAGYKVEDDLVSTGTKVVYFPVQTDHKRAERDVSIFEKIHLAAFAQKHWADNAVSVTVSFDPDSEAEHLATVLHMHEGALKTVSFLPSGNTVYPQQPYTSLDENSYREAVAGIRPVDLSPIYAGGALDAAGELYCTTDACELKVVPGAAEFENEADVEAANATDRRPR